MTDNIDPNAWFEDWQSSWNANHPEAENFWEQWQNENPTPSWEWEQPMVEQPQAQLAHYEDVGGITQFFVTRLPGWINDLGEWTKQHAPDWAEEGYKGVKPIFAPILQVGMEALDIMAEGIERLAGMGVQYAAAARQGTLDDFNRNLKAAWSASHWTWNVMGNDLLNYYYDEQTGDFRMRIAEWSGTEQMARLRKMYIDGASHEDVDAAMMNDWGAVWFRGAMWDCVGHVFLDPINVMAPKAMTRMATWAKDNVGRFIAPEAITKLEGALEMAVNEAEFADHEYQAALKIQEAAGDLARLEDVEDVINFARLEKRAVDTENVMQLALDVLSKAEGKIPNRLQRFILKVTGNWQPTVAEAMQRTFKWYKPWTYFHYGQDAKLMDLVHTSADQLAHVTSNTRDLDDALRVIKQVAYAIEHPAAGGYFLSPATRGLQSIVAQYGLQFDDLAKALDASGDQRHLLRMISEGLGLKQTEVLGLLKSEGGVEKAIKQIAGLAETLTEASDIKQVRLVQMLQPLVEGGEAAISGKSLKGLVTMFGDGKIPFNLETFKLHIIDAIEKSVTTTLTASGGIEAVGPWQKAAAMVKSFETLAFLKMNPGYLARNFWNNEISMLAAGCYGVKFKEAELLKIWKKLDILEPSRLRSGFTMAQIEDMERAEGSVKAALQNAEDMLRQAARGDYTAVDKITDTVNQISLGNFDMGAWASKAESWASMRAYTTGMLKARRGLWQPKKGFSHIKDYVQKEFPHFDPDVLPSTLTNALHDTVKGASNMQEVREGIFDLNMNMNWGVVMDRTAARMGVSVDMVEDFVGPEVRAFLESEILALIKGGANDDDINYLLWNVHDMVQTHMDEMVKLGVDPISHQTYAMLQAGQPNQGLVHLYGQQMDEYMDAYKVHKEIQAQVMEDIRRADVPYAVEREMHRARIADETRYWQRVNLRQKARLDALEAAMEDGVRVSGDLRDAYNGLHTAMDDFFGFKNRELDKFFNRKPEFWDKLRETKGVTRSEVYDQIMHQINVKWDEAITLQRQAYEKIDKALIAQITQSRPEQAVFVQAWRRTVADLREDHLGLINRMYVDDIPNRPTDPDQLIAWHDGRSDQLIQSQNLVLQAEREGMDSMVTGLPFGQNHQLDINVRTAYMKNVLASQNEHQARELLNFLASEDPANSHAIVEMVQSAASRLGIDVQVVPIDHTETFFDRLLGLDITTEEFGTKVAGKLFASGQPLANQLWISELVVNAAGGDLGAYTELQQVFTRVKTKYLNAGLDLEKSPLIAKSPWMLSMFEADELDAARYFYDTLLHEIVHANQGISYGATSFDRTVSDPLFHGVLKFVDPTDLHYGDFPEWFQNMWKGTDKRMTDAQWLDFWRTTLMKNDLIAPEFTEFHARLMSWYMIDPAAVADYYKSPKLLEYCEQWVQQKPELIHALAGRGSMEFSPVVPMPLHYRAVQKQSKLMSQDIAKMWDWKNGGSYSPYYMRHMAGTDARAVTILKDTQTEMISPEGIRRFISEHADLLADPRNVVGWWQRPDKTWEIAVSTLVEDEDLAHKLARTYDQESIFDLLQMREIKTKQTFKPFDVAEMPGQAVNPLDHFGITTPRTITGPANSGPAMDVAYYQRLVPEMFMPHQGLDTIWMGQGRNFIDNLGVTLRQQRDMAPLRLEDEILKLPAHQQGQARMALRSWTDNLAGEMRATNAASAKYGEWIRDVALLNYHKRTYFDHYAGMVFPFSFWTTHTAWKWFWFSTIEKPYIMADFFRIHNALTQHGAAQLPQRMQGMIPIGKLPFLPDWMGEVFANPIKAALPFDFWFEPIWNEQTRAVSTVRNAERILQQGLDENRYNQQDFDIAMNSQSGPAWDDAILRAKNTTEGYDPVETLSWLVAPHAPLMWAYYAAQGKPEEITPFLPATRTIKGISALMGVPNGGINIEAWIREKMGLPKFDQWDDYRVDRMLSNMVATGEITHQQAMAAMEEREGNKWFEIAQERAGSEYGLKALGSAFGVPLGSYPPGEERARSLVDGLYEAYEREEQGETGIVNAYFEQYPEVQTRLAIHDAPADRLHSFLVDEIWDKYMNLPSLQKRDVRETFGDNFQYYFLDKETRAETEIPVEMLAVWLKLLGGDPPGTLREADQVPPMPMADPSIANRAQVFYDTRERDYPNWYDEQKTYYAINEDNWSERKKYKDSHPELVAYWSWRRDWLMRNPTVAPYLTDSPVEYETQMEAEAAYTNEPNYTWQEWSIVMPPTLWFLIQHSMSGQSMPEEAREELELMAEAYGITVADLIDKLRGAWSAEFGY